jgi:biopolymer transport protein ExbD
LAIWDIFHADSLELERSLSTDAIRAALAGGVLRDDDLVRPAGTTVAWTRLGDFPELAAAEAIEAPKIDGAPVPEPELRMEAPPPSAEPPERIRSARAESPPPQPGSSDFELRADRLDEVPELDVPTASTSRSAPPPWLELGGEPDDVTFPVILDRPNEQLVSAPPGPLAREPGREHSAPSAWVWPDDDDGEDQAGGHGDEAEGGDFDEQIEILDDDAAGLEILDEDGLSVPSPFSREATGGNGSSHVGLPVVPSRDWNEDRAPVEGGDADDFTFSRRGPMTVEELDLAPMVDVAFQLVLFFMVTATTVLYKTLEIPKPTTDQAPGAVAQGHSRSVEDLKDYVLVEIDVGGTVKIDREPVPADVDAIAERLRTAREKTGRKVMLLSADYSTPHRHAVLAYDAAIEIGMEISIARPNPPQGPAPSVFPGRGPGAAARPSGGGSSPPPTAPQTRPTESAAPDSNGAPF